MMKTVIKRALLGFPLGITINYTITMIISLIFAEGDYFPCVPALVDTAGSVIGAVILQAALSGILGAAFAGASCIWEVGDWSIAKQTGIYFLISSLAMFPIAYVAHWMPHTFVGFLSYAAIFVALFAIIWLTQYAVWKSKLKRINREMSENQKA